MNGLHVQGVSEHEADLIFAAKIGEPIIRILTDATVAFRSESVKLWRDIWFFLGVTVVSNS